MIADIEVFFYAGLGTQRHEIWRGRLCFLPSAGDEVTHDDGESSYTVQRVTHWLATKKRQGFVEIYVR